LGLPDGELDRLNDLSKNGPADIAATAQGILDKAPQIDAAYVLYWNAWHALGTERSGGMGVTCIPLSAIWRYCDRMVMTRIEAEIFEQIIRRVDMHYVSKRAAEQAKSVK
jgi:hypothetical protein